MSQHDDETRLRDMLDYAHKGIEAIRNRSRADLDSDLILAAALKRYLDIEL